MECLKRIIIHDRSRVLNQWEDLYTNLSIEFAEQIPQLHHMVYFIYKYLISLSYWRR